MLPALTWCLFAKGSLIDCIIARGKFSNDVDTRSAGEEGKILARDASTLAGTGERRGQTLVLNLVGTKAADALNAGSGGDAVGGFKRDGRMPVAAHGSGGSEIEVGRKLAVQPGQHGLAEASNHDAHRGHHGDGCGESCDKD